MIGQIFLSVLFAFVAWSAVATAVFGIGCWLLKKERISEEGMMLFWRVAMYGGAVPGLAFGVAAFLFLGGDSPS